LLMVFVVPLVFIALHRFVEESTYARAVLLGLALAVSGLACAYYGLMMGLAVGVGAIWFAVGHETSKRYWLRMMLAAVVAVGAIAPALAPYAALRNQEGFRSSLNLEEADSYSADTRAFVRGHSRAMNLLMSGRFRAYVGGDGEVLFPGVFVAVLALAGVVAAGTTVRGTAAPNRAQNGRIAAFYAVVMLLALWASLGPKAGLYTLLAEWVPFMSFLRAPARMGVLVLFAVAIFAGSGIAWLERRSKAAWLAPALLILTVAELQVAWPLRVVPPVADAYKMLAGLPRAGTLVLQFPYRQGEWFPHADYMFWSMYHWQPMVNGYSDFIPADIRDLAVPINGFPDPESFRLLRQRNVRYVAIDWRMYNEAATEIMRARFAPYTQFLRPLVTTEPVSLYEIVAWPDGLPR
jgi:hypothetical protein